MSEEGRTDQTAKRCGRVKGDSRVSIYFLSGLVGRGLRTAPRALSVPLLLLRMARCGDRALTNPLKN